jgi:hypothetical protein
MFLASRPAGLGSGCEWQDVSELNAQVEGFVSVQFVTCGSCNSYHTAGVTNYGGELYRPPANFAVLAAMCVSACARTLESGPL